MSTKQLLVKFLPIHPALCVHLSGNRFKTFLFLYKSLTKCQISAFKAELAHKCFFFHPLSDTSLRCFIQTSCIIPCLVDTKITNESALLFLLWRVSLLAYITNNCCVSTPASAGITLNLWLNTWRRKSTNWFRFSRNNTKKVEEVKIKGGD